MMIYYDSIIWLKTHLSDVLDGLDYICFSRLLELYINRIKESGRIKQQWYKKVLQLEEQLEQARMDWRERRMLRRLINDMKKKRDSNFYATLEWGEMRIFIIKKYSRTCTECGFRPARQVHHWNDPRYFPELALDKNNLTLLCDECHDKYHRKNKKKD